MKLHEAYDEYYTASGTASTIGRQLALSGVAVVWLLSGGLVKSHVTLTFRLAMALLFILIAVAIDVVQYLWATGMYSIFAHHKESQEKKEAPNTAEDPVLDRNIGDAWPAIVWGIWGLWMVKFGALAVGYIFVLMAVAHQVSIT